MITYEVNVVCDRCKNAIVSGAPNELVHLAIESAQEFATRTMGWNRNIHGKWLCPNCQPKPVDEKAT